MTPPIPLDALAGALAIGTTGGALLAYSRRNGRRGIPALLPYACVLFALDLFLSHASGIKTGQRLGICFYALFLSVLIPMYMSLVQTARTGGPLRAEADLMLSRRAWIWGLPLVLLLVMGASAGVAYLSSYRVTPLRAKTTLPIITVLGAGPKKTLTQRQRPTGLRGTFALWSMNRRHSALTDWGLGHLST